MLLWDSTKTGEKRYPASGLKRVADRLLKELQAAGQPVLPLKWDGDKRMFLDLAHHNPAPKSGTVSIFDMSCEKEKKESKKESIAFSLG